ncbi:CG10202 [Drosophila busckii]|uniref:CG10202 n=1 Tax=Drosophila busckii TaxID=30019 RepID=A0A0M4EBT9_DROBS|nr:glucose 1,6-bisphosphate synthase [Drosophila busckii]ALC41065.1 CG10202 [Drosophila busckii]
MLAPNAPTTPAELIKSLELSGRDELDMQIKNWIMWDRNDATLQQVVSAVKEKDWDALEQRLCHRNAFGTAGLRAGMRAGFDSINDLTIIQTAQGLSSFLTEQYPNVVRRETQGVVIGYDGRYNSKRLAQLTATVMLNGRCKVYLFNRITTTPLVAFGVVHLKCLAGVMVTGSHNAKHDNGFKVYWTNGAPIVAPLDKQIQAAVLNCLEPVPSNWDLSILDEHALLEDPYREVYPAYYEAMSNLLPYNYIETNECSQLRFVYTALHGAGYPYIREAFYQARLKPVIPVPEQKDSDPEFPTISFPDPIEGKDSLNLAIRKAEEEHCTIILANDPDGDRLAVAELDPKGRWKIFNGNELGALLGWWALESYKTRTPKPNVSNCVMIGSLVSSKILAAMARAEGFTFVETLVGFKWMSSKALELQALGKTVLLAFEQPIGYMFTTMVADKDGINAACQVATMACYLRSTRNVTLIEKLREIYDTYGYHCTMMQSMTYKSPWQVDKMFTRLRSFDDEQPGTYPKCILNGEFDVRSVRDLTTGLDTSFPDNKARMPVSPNKHMITFTFTNGMTFTVRDSGTEPKIKIYSEIFGLPEEKEWDELHDTLKRMTEAAISEFIQPDEMGLT